jgi:hypothetical protein
MFADMLVVLFVLSTRKTCVPHDPVFPLEDLSGVQGAPFFEILCLTVHGCIRYPRMISVKISFDPSLYQVRI